MDSSGRFGIGTTSMSSFYATKFVVNVGDEDGITIYNDGANERAYIMFADGTSGTERYPGQISYDHYNDQMSFTAGASTRVMIEGSGSNQGSVNVLDGDLVITTSGHGIQFSGHSPSGTGSPSPTINSSKLDDYEEGYWLSLIHI